MVADGQSIWNRIIFKKPKIVIVAEEDSGKLKKSLSLFDLVMLGAAGTIGAGLFSSATSIVAGAGPAAVLSWTVAGLAAILAGFSFMEMATRVPSSGSTYAYAYHALGELPACISGFLLSLEFGFSAAAVARSWSDKFVEWLGSHDIIVPDILHGGSHDFLAALLMLATVLVVVSGMSMSKKLINIISVVKIAFVLFMTVIGFIYFKGSNLKPFVPAQVGAQGFMLGASSAFFAYIGFDEVVCMSAETHQPRQTVPKAVFITVCLIASIYILANLALVGLLPFGRFTDASGVALSGFAAVFSERNLSWASEIVRVGETFTMPVVVLAAFIAQPTLLFAMAEDGIIPKIFGHVHSTRGTLFWGVWISGIAMVVLAFFVSFRVVGDVAVLGILLSFNITSSCVVVLRYREDSPRFAPALWFAFFFLSFVGICFAQYLIIDSMTTVGIVLASLFLGVSICCIIVLVVMCRLAKYSERIYQAPLTPFTQALTVMINWYIFVQLSCEAIQFFLAYLGIALLTYFGYGYRNSVGHLTGWRELIDYASNQKIRKSSFSSDVSSMRSTDDDPSDDESELDSRDGSYRSTSSLNTPRRDIAHNQKLGVSVAATKSNHAGTHTSATPGSRMSMMSADFSDFSDRLSEGRGEASSNVIDMSQESPVLLMDQNGGFMRQTPAVTSFRKIL